MMIKIRCLVIFVVLIFGTQAYCAPTPQACFGFACVNVDVVNTPKDMERGLSGRKELGNDQGMLFIFESAGDYSFWMKDMNFNLDIIWLNEKLQVVDIKEKFAPCTPQSCPIYTPQAAARYVLEVNADYCQKHGIKLGHRLRLNGVVPLYL